MSGCGAGCSEEKPCMRCAKRLMEKDSESVSAECDGRWNGYYIEASQEAYNKLIELGYEESMLGYDKLKKGLGHNFLFIEDGIVTAFLDENMRFQHQQFCLVDGEFTETKGIEQICDNPDVNSLQKKKGGECKICGDYYVSPDGLEKHETTCSYTILEDVEPFEVTEAESSFAGDVRKILDDLAELLISKNKKYGNSALEPKRIFSKASAVEQILVRIDDKLSRMSNQDGTDDEDIVEDLLGYLVLLKIAKSNVL